MLKPKLKFQPKTQEKSKPLYTGKKENFRNDVEKVITQVRKDVPIVIKIENIQEPQYKPVFQRYMLAFEYLYANRFKIDAMKSSTLKRKILTDTPLCFSLNAMWAQNSGENREKVATIYENAIYFAKEYSKNELKNNNVEDADITNITLSTINQRLYLLRGENRDKLNLIQSYALIVTRLKDNVRYSDFVKKSRESLSELLKGELCSNDEIGLAQRGIFHKKGNLWKVCQDPDLRGHNNLELKLK